MRSAFEGAAMAALLIVLGCVGGLIGWGLGAFFYHAGLWIAAPVTVAVIIGLGALAGYRQSRPTPTGDEG